MKQSYEKGYFIIQSDNYGYKKKREDILNRNKDFEDYINKIFENHLITEYWEEEDPDGKSGGVYIDMEYKNQDTFEFITIKGGKIEVIQWNENGDESEDVILTDEQLIVVGILIQGFEAQAFEDQADAKEWAKGEYHYNGVSIRDFI